MSKILWKSFKADFKNDHGSIKWEVGKWLHQDGAIELCSNGFHASKNIIDAMGYVNCEILAKVEVKGKSDISDDKQAWSDMKILEAYDWKKENSVALAIYAAELCIANFEKQYANDKRPREAIEAAKNWLENPNEKNRLAAWSAWSAAESAAESAARSAESAAESAWSAWSEKQMILNKCHKFVITQLTYENRIK